MSDYSDSIEKALNSNKNKEEENKQSKNKIEAKFNYKKEEIFGEIKVSKKWKIEVTKTSWNGRKSKYEIRKWKKDGTPGKGVTCTKEQLEQLIKIINEIELSDSNETFEKNDIVENINGQRGKVKKIEGDYLLVNGRNNNERWNVKDCKFVKKGKNTY